MFKYLVFFFFSSRRRHTRLQGDWSSDVCSSDLPDAQPVLDAAPCASAVSLLLEVESIEAAVAGFITRKRADELKRVEWRVLGEPRSEEHTSELQSPCNLVCRLLLEKKKRTSVQDSTLRRITNKRRYSILTERLQMSSVYSKHLWYQCTRI